MAATATSNAITRLTSEDTDELQMDDPPMPDGFTAEKPLRRSARRVVPTQKFRSSPRLSPVSENETSSPTTDRNEAQPRRNPKRKAAEAAAPSQDFTLPDNLLEEALKPLKFGEISEWEGWCELESEPAFFSTILRELGIKNIKAQEIFSIDQDSLDMLPQPVYGLIFLFQYHPSLDNDEDGHDSETLWFANQTTQNACATVALLNIVMNADNLDLGAKLQDFKESTKDLSTTLKGHQLSNNRFIRTIHNSFARRMDHLTVDLGLENEYSEAASAKSAKRRPASKKSVGKASSRKKKRPTNEDAYHFIAYVPADGQVWELDGLKSKPLRLGYISEGEPWTAIAKPQIEARILQYEETQLSFNLISLCQSPQAHHSISIAKGMQSLNQLRNRMKENSDFIEMTSPETFISKLEDEDFLSDFQLTVSDVQNAKAPASQQEHQLTSPTLDVRGAYEMHEQLVTETKAAIGEYRAEMIAVAEDEQRVEGRRKDYGLALHRWVQKLAEKGVLEQLIKDSQ